MALSPKAIRRIYVWHKWTGLISGLFILFVVLTGTLAVFKNEIDAAITPGKSVTPGTTLAPLESVLTEMKRAYPKSRVGQINLADARRPSDVHQVNIKDKPPGASKAESREVFINPYTGKITGSRVGESLSDIIRQTHLRFYYFGWQGRVAVGVVGLFLIFSTLSGWMIYGPFMKKLVWGRIRWKQRLQLVVSDWHKMLGFATVLFNLVIGLTGAVLGLENLGRFAHSAQRIIHPVPSPETKKNRPANIEGRLTMDEALAKAREALPGFQPTSITMPRAKRSHWMLRGNIDGHFAAEGMTWLVLDTHTGKAIQIHDARIAQPLTRAYNLSEPFHFGDFAGIPLKLLYCLLGLLSSSISITGFWLWFLKTRKKKPRELPAQHAAGATNSLI